MTWAAQVGHVLRRDLRRFRWYLAGFSVLVVSLVVRAYAVGDRIDLFNSFLLLLVVTGMFVVALATQADPPTAADANWRVLPLEPSAVFGAKLALLGLVMLLGLIGQYAALRAFGLDLADEARLMAGSMIPMLSWLLGSMLIAAHTRDARWYLTVLVVTPIALTALLWLGTMSMMFVNVGFAAALPESAALVAVWRVVILAAAALLLWFVYTRRLGSRISMAAACLVMLFGLGIGITDAMVGAAVPSRITLDSQSPVGVDASVAIDISEAEVSTVSLRLSRAETPAADRLMIDGSTLVLRFPDSTVTRLDLRYGAHASIMPSDLPSGNYSLEYQAMGETLIAAQPIQIGATTTRWPGSRFVEHRFTLPTSFSESQRQAIDSGRVDAWLEGDASLIEAQVAVELPTRPGTTVAARGIRAQVLERPSRRTRTRVERAVRISELSGVSALPRATFSTRLGGVSALLVSASGEQSMMLSEDQLLAWDRGLVLPGVTHTTTLKALRPAGISRRADSLAPGPAWMDSARVVILQWSNPRGVRLDMAPSRLTRATLPPVANSSRALEMTSVGPR